MAATSSWWNRETIIWSTAQHGFIGSEGKYVTTHHVLKWNTQSIPNSKKCLTQNEGCSGFTVITGGVSFFYTDATGKCWEVRVVVRGTLGYIYWKKTQKNLKLFSYMHSYMEMSRQWGSDFLWSLPFTCEEHSRRISSQTPHLSSKIIVFHLSKFSCLLYVSGWDMIQSKISK